MFVQDKTLIQNYSGRQVNMHIKTINVMVTFLFQIFYINFNCGINHVG